MWYQVPQPPQRPLQPSISRLSPILFINRSTCLSFLVLLQWHSGFWSPVMARSILSHAAFCHSVYAYNIRPSMFNNWQIRQENPTRFCILHSPAVSQEQVLTICHHILRGHFLHSSPWISCYFITSFSVLFLW